jgi:hypothetical protein
VATAPHAQGELAAKPLAPAILRGKGSPMNFSASNPNHARNPNDLSDLSDADLADLAHQWRARAMRGDRAAFGPAQALEVEQRRRLRDSMFVELAPEKGPYQTDRPWWKFW